MESLQQLIQGCIKADRHCQSLLYSRISASMLVVCLRYSRNREEAEEVLQEGFLQVFKSIHQFRGEGSFEGWVRKIMVNCSLQKIRSRSHLTPVYTIDQSREEPADNEFIYAELSAKELIGLVQQLPPMYRAVFNLYVFEGMKHREIAEALGVSEGTSKSNLSDARKILQTAVLKSNMIAKPNNL